MEDDEDVSKLSTSPPSRKGARSPQPTTSPPSTSPPPQSPPSSPPNGSSVLSPNTRGRKHKADSKSRVKDKERDGSHSRTSSLTGLPSTSPPSPAMSLSYPTLLQATSTTSTSTSTSSSSSSYASSGGNVTASTSASRPHRTKSAKKIVRARSNQPPTHESIEEGISCSPALAHTNRDSAMPSALIERCQPATSNRSEPCTKSSTSLQVRARPPLSHNQSSSSCDSSRELHSKSGIARCHSSNEYHLTCRVAMHRTHAATLVALEFVRARDRHPASPGRLGQPTLGHLASLSAQVTLGQRR